MSTFEPKGRKDRKRQTSFQLIDERGAGEPYAGLAFDIVDQEGGKYRGYLDAAGIGKVSGQLVAGPLIVMFTQAHDLSCPVYSRLIDREHSAPHISELQVRAEHTQYLNACGARTCTRPSHIAAGAEYFQIEVRHLVEHVAHLPLAVDCCYPLETGAQRFMQSGVELAVERHTVLEVRPLRALRPMLSADSQFCALNLYQLALMATLNYYPFKQEPDEQPRAYCPLYEEVAYSRRFEVVPFDPMLYPGNDPLAFVTHSDEIILIVVRCTGELPDFLCDDDALQVPFAEGEGKVHRGFYEAARRAYGFVCACLDRFYAGQSVLVCGQGRGGAIALILAQMLRRRSEADYAVQLYTYGAPCAVDVTFVSAAASLEHQRMVNHNDPLPGIPRDGSGELITFTHVPAGFGVFMAGPRDVLGEPYRHHGTLRYFMPLDLGQGEVSHVMWAPVSNTVTQYAASHAVLKPLSNVNQQSYISSCWAALRRYQSALETGHSRVTEREVMFIDQAFEQVSQQLRVKYHEQMIRSDKNTQGRERIINLLMHEISKIHATRQHVYDLRFKTPSLADVYGQFARCPERLARWMGCSDYTPSE